MRNLKEFKHRHIQTFEFLRETNANMLNILKYKIYVEKNSNICFTFCKKRKRNYKILV